MKNKILLMGIVFLIFAIAGACQPQPEHSPVITPTPAGGYWEQSEEALAALIHAAAVEMETDAKIATGVLSDGVLTDEEISKTAANIHAVQSAIRTANDLVEVYIFQYGEISYETTDLLIVAVEDLDSIAGLSNEAVHYLEQDATSPEAEQLVEVLLSLKTEAAKIRSQTEAWFLAVQTALAERQKRAANTQPQAGQVVYNRVEAFIQAHDYLDAFTTALDDEKISAEELAHISQLAATAKSSLYNTGDPELMGIAQRINALTDNASRGEWQQASVGLDELQLSLPARPRPF